MSPRFHADCCALSTSRMAFVSASRARAGLPGRGIVPSISRENPAAMKTVPGRSRMTWLLLKDLALSEHRRGHGGETSLARKTLGLPLTVFFLVVYASGSSQLVLPTYR